MRTPVVLITGVAPDPMAAATVGLLWDLPNAVAVHHRIDPDAQVLHRVVSDASGVLEREEIPLAHACVSCAIREEVVPTIERVARDGRWKTVLAHLPVGAEAGQVCTVMSWDERLARHVRISSVVAAFEGDGLVEDLLGDSLLRERGRHSGPDDARGVGEVACGQIEYADTLVVTGHPEQVGLDLLATLARPGVPLVVGAENLDARSLVAPLHEHGRTRFWAAHTTEADLGEPASALVWRHDLYSPRGLHPGRLLEGLDPLGGGRHRSRGCFWLPTRPGRALRWDGAGGQLSIGPGEGWGRRAPFTRIVITGVGEPPTHLEDAFDALLLGPDLEGGDWHVAEDGFEPWLGGIRDVA